MAVEGVGESGNTGTDPIQETDSGKGRDGKEVTSATTIKNEADLKELAPEILEGMQVALFEWMVRQQKASQERIKKLNREMGNPG